MTLSRLSSGWMVVATLSVTETISWGILYYGFPVMLRSLEQDLGASRVAVTGAFSVGMGTAALAAVPVGRWLDRQGPRVLMTLGSCLGTALLLAWSRIESLGALYLVWGGMGLAMAATLYEPAFAALMGWFTGRQRDRALLIVTLAGGLASTIFMPLAAWLVGWLGWRGALMALAAILGVTTIPLHAAVLRRPPRGTDPGADPATGRTGPAASGVSLGGALRMPVFWALAGAFVIGNFATVSVTMHLIPYLVERGFTAALAATMIGWVGAMQLPGRFVFAPIANRLGPRWVTAAVLATQAAAIGQLPVAAFLPSLAPFVVMLGAANGMSTLARATTVAEIFGARHYASIGGAVALGANGARAVGPVGASLLRVALGGYERVFGVLAASLVLAALAVLWAGGRGPRRG